MLAKPEYFSPPDEVCCRQGRRWGATTGAPMSRLLAGALWRSCRPGRRCRMRNDACSLPLRGSYSSIGKLLLAGGTDADWQRAPWKTMGSGNRNKRRQGKQPAGREQLREAAAGREHHREAAAGRGDRKNGLVVSQCLGKLCQRLLCLLRLWCLAVPCAGALHKVHAFAHYGIHKNHYRLV